METSGLLDELGRVVLNEHLARNLYLMRVESPKIAASALPGQFVHTSVPGMEGHILRRPFSLYDASSEKGTFDILYQVLGFGTRCLTYVEAGQHVSNIGPVGHGWWVPQACERALLVGGGVGAAPLFMHARALKEAGVEVDLVLGAQSAEALVTDERYKDELGIEAIVSTDDGTRGHAGFCTAPTQKLLDSNVYDHIACCGPEPLMRIIADMAAHAGVECQVSMERRMACGIGACLSCVVDTDEGKQRCCVDGPVFDAAKVVW